MDPSNTVFLFLCISFVILIFSPFPPFISFPHFVCPLQYAFGPGGMLKFNSRESGDKRARKGSGDEGEVRKR
jgi:hypothetical protein